MESLMIAHQLSSSDFSNLRILLLLDSGKVQGISVQHQTISQLSGQPKTPSATSGNPLIRAIVQTFAQLGLTLPVSQGSSTESTSSVTNSTASGGLQGSGANSHMGSLSAAGVDSLFEQFIGRTLQVASSLQSSPSSSLTSQSDSGNQGNPADETGYSNPLAQGLESLSRSVSARSSQPADSSSNGDTSSTTSLNEAISSLETDFNTLFGSSGTDNSPSLQTFLQTLSSNIAELAASGSSGAFVRTSA
jgi:hypothetical protein